MSTAQPAWEPALRGLAARVLGDLAGQVSFAGLDRAGRQFTTEAGAGQLLVRATDAGSAAVGLHDCRRPHCGMEVSWDEPRPPAPSHLPDAPPLF